MLEECFCCGAWAPRWDTAEYEDWSLELTPAGEYLGVVCPGCFAGEGLAFLDVEAEEPIRIRRARPRGSLRSGTRAAGALAA